MNGPPSSSERRHGTAVAIGEKAALLCGPSGSGKSDLALRFISTPLALEGDGHGRKLVGDDQVVISNEGDGLVVAPAEKLKGLMEVRGLGVLSMPHLPKAELCLLVDLVASGEVARMPQVPLACETILGVEVPRLTLSPFEASAAQKLFLALLMASERKKPMFTGE